MLRKYVLCLAGLSLLLIVSVFLIEGWPSNAFAASDDWEQLDPENIEIIFAPNGEPLIADEAYQLTTRAGYVRNAIYYSKAQIFAFLSYGKVGHGTYYRETSLEPKRLLRFLNEPAPSNISNSKTVNSHFGSAKYITFEHDSNDCFATTVFWLLYANGYRRALDIVYCRQLGGPINESGVGSILSGIGITGEKEPPSLTVTRAETAVQRREERRKQRQRNQRELQEELSVVRVGATREQVEGVLGEPDESESGDGATIHVYRHQRGSSAKVVMYVTYGPDGRVTRAETATQRRERQQRERRELEEEVSVVVKVGATREQVEGVLGEPDESESGDGATIHVYRHQRGSAKVVMYVTYGPDGRVTRAVRPETAAQHRKEEKRWETADLRAKAQCGDAHAQFALGYRYITGWGVAQDFARAYFWYGIANTGGVGAPPRAAPFLSGRITPEQIAEGERLTAEWEPKDCDNGDAGNVASVSYAADQAAMEQFDGRWTGIIEGEGLAAICSNGTIDLTIRHGEIKGKAPGSGTSHYEVSGFVNQDGRFVNVIAAGGGVSILRLTGQLYQRREFLTRGGFPFLC